MASGRFPFAESIDFKEVPGGLQYQLTFWKSLNIIVTVIVSGFEPAAWKVRTLESLSMMSNQLCFIPLFQRQPNNIHHSNTSNTNSLKGVF